MSADTIRIGVIGGGFIGKIHLAHFGKIPGVELTGIFDAKREIATKVAADFKVAMVFDTVESMIKSPQIDAIVVAVPNKYHKDLAIKSLEADKHVLLEKPMALNSAESLEIVQTQQKTGKILMMAHQMRWNWLCRKIKDHVEKGSLGKIYNAKTGMWRLHNIPGWGSWFTRMDEAGGGPLIDIGVHALDLALYLMDNPKPVSVFGSTYAQFGPKRKGLGSWGTPEWDGYFDVEDLATAMIKMENGSTLTLEVSWAAHTDSEHGFFVHLMGADGGASLYSHSAKLISHTFNQSISVDLKKPDNVEDNPRILLSEHFIECLRNGATPISDATSGYINMKVLDAIYESARTNKNVDIDLGL